MRNIKWLLYSCLLLISCNRAPSNEKQADSIHVANEISREDSNRIFTNDVKDWMQEKLARDTLSRQNFVLEEHWQEQPAEATSFDANTQFIKDYNSVLRWSPDSNYIIDIGSYGTVLTKDSKGNTVIEAGEPDTELALIEPAKKLRKRLMFVGPSSAIIDAKWIDNKQVAVIGTFDSTGNGTNDTLLWMIDVQKDFFRLYNVKSHR